MANPGINLTVAGGGMTRLRTKGAAAQNSLYQLTNGYVTQAQTVKVRPGTFRTANLGNDSDDANATVGLTFYKDTFHVFSNTLVDVPAGYECDVLKFPTEVAVTVPNPAVGLTITVPSILHFEDGNGSTAFTDGGAAGLSWAASGAAAESTAQAKFGTGSAHFGASGNDYITAAVAAAGAADITGAGDWTVEFWIYPLDIAASAHYWVDLSNGGNTLFYFWHDNAQFTVTVQGAWASNIAVSAGGIVANAWQHIAICRDGTLLRAYRNGVLEGVSAISTDPPALSGSPTYVMGTYYGHVGSVGPNGYIDEFRITKGACLYGGNFTPVGPLTTTPAPTYSLQTLMHFDDGNTSTAFVDSSSPPNAWVAAGAAQESTAVFKLGTGSGKFVNDADYISYAVTAGGSLDLTSGNQDWTVESFVYPTDISSGDTCLWWDFSNTESADYNETLFWLRSVNNDLYVDDFSGGGLANTRKITNAFPTANTWYHVAVERYGGILRVYVNGVAATDLALSATTMPTLTTGANIFLGASNQGAGGIYTANGYIDEFRVLNGLAAYHANFTPPAAPYLSPGSTPIPLKQIHFAAPFMGFLYVVAEFDVTDSATLAEFGDTYHFWLQSTGSWKADTVYLPSDIVTPTTPNGLAYQATRLSAPNSLWTANTQIALNQIVEPNTPNGYMFQAIAVEGASPHTGTVEPTWPTVINGTIQEFGDFSSLDTTDPTTGAPIQTPGTAITDRYGNPYAAPPASSTTVAAAVTAATKIIPWAPGILTFPGTVTQASTSQGAFVNAIPNGDFESGDDGSWVFNSPWAIDATAAHAYHGTHCAQFAGGAATAQLMMNSQVAVTPGQSVTLTAYLNPNNVGANLTMVPQLLWYKADTTTLISTSSGANIQGAGYRPVTLTATAPALAAFCVAAIQGESGTSHRNVGYADYISWNLETPAATSQFLFEAVQADAATTGTTEPTWPTISGNTVVDGGVTWKAVGASIITWQALPIMESGDTEPTWPTTVGVAVANGNMSFTCVSRQITDKNCPQSKVVAIGQSKVYAVDQDTIPFCATTNPLDWTTQFDAGYLPFGIQTYGSEPCAALGLYRSNLVAANSLGYQMWQIDPDPANMALLDAQPVGTTYPLSMQPVQNDLVFLTARGIRSLGISGASGNVMAGQFGKNLDPLVLASIAAGGEPLGEPVGLFYPGTGQYWLIFGTTVYVQTNNGSGNANSWSMYEFPDAISYWTVANGELYLRAGDLVWHVNEDALYDDIQDPAHPGSTSVPFTGAMSWPFLDLGTPGVDKDFEGVNLTCTGLGTVAVGYDQSNFSLVTPTIDFDGDTLPGIGMIPIPMTAPSFQIQLTWDAGQAWEWNMTTIYVRRENST